MLSHLGIADPIRPSTILDFIRFKMVRRPPHQFTSTQATYVGEGFHHHKFCIASRSGSVCAVHGVGYTHFTACLRWWVCRASSVIVFEERLEEYEWLLNWLQLLCMGTGLVVVRMCSLTFRAPERWWMSTRMIFREILYRHQFELAMFLCGEANGSDARVRHQQFGRFGWLIEWLYGCLVEVDPLLPVGYFADYCIYGRSTIGDRWKRN